MTPTGISPRLTDILTLSEQQQRLFRWMNREREVTLDQAIAFLQQSPQAVAALMNSLMEADLVEEWTLAEPHRYRPRLPAKQGSQLPDRIQQSILPGSPLGILLNPSERLEAFTDGQPVYQRVTVTNKGHQAAIIDVSLNNGGVAEWCTNPQQRLALGSQQSSEVSFEIKVPPQVIPGTFAYSLIVDAPEHYPEDTPIIYEQQLQVFAAVTETTRATDPTFTIAPATSSTQPLPVLPGETLALEIQIHNRGDRVDRFRLTCPDLDSHWYEVQYPEGFALPGIVTETDGLPLNPGARGHVTLLLHPPLGTQAGQYFPTVSLHSANTPDTRLLDVVYLTVLPVQALTLEWLALRDTVQHEPGEYRLEVRNYGNCDRTLTIALVEPPGRQPYSHRLSTETLQLLPGAEQQVGLQIQPGPWWRRPWFGNGRFISFDVRLKDADALPISPASYQGNLLWQPRPFWQLLLVALAALGLIGTLILAIWLLFLRPPAPPKVLSLQATDTTYEATRDEAIQLNWRIRNAKELAAIQLIGRSPDGTVLSPAVTYSLAAGMPPQLDSVCEQVRRDLICQNVLTDARKPGDYIFELSTFTKQAPDEVLTSATTDTIQLLPIAQPQVKQFTAAPPEADSSIVPASWEITHPDQLASVTLVGRREDSSISVPLKTWDLSEGLPKGHPLVGNCEITTVLTCNAIPIPVEKAGTTVFTLTAIPKTGSDEDPSARQSEPIIVEAMPPEIVSFLVNGQETGPGYIVELNRDRPVQDVTISWAVKADPDARVELLPAPGPVLAEGATVYPVTQQSGQQTITLKVTPETGEPVTRSFILDVFDPSAGETPSVADIPLPALPLPPGGTPPGAPGMLPGASAPGSGAVPPTAAGEALTPTEVPPQFD